MNIIERIKQVKREEKDLERICDIYLKSINYYYYIDCEDYEESEETFLELEEEVKKWLKKDDNEEEAKRLLELLF